MDNAIGKQWLVARLRPAGEDVWAIIPELAEMDEERLRQLLRPHAEMRFKNDAQGGLDKDRRRRLDVVLGALTILEIAYETDVASPETELAPEAENLIKLFKSEAFLRYVNAYLYFGIRFLAWRMIPPEWADGNFKSALSGRKSAAPLASVSNIFVRLGLACRETSPSCAFETFRFSHRSGRSRDRE
jgi:hypothetical protein